MEDRKKIITLSLIGIAILLLTVIGSAFAFFSIVNNSQGETNTNFNGITENLAKYGIPTLNQGVGNIHVNVTVSDMSPEKIGASYWATDIEKENHKSERQNHIISTAKIEGQTTEEETYLQCTSEVLITATGSLVDEDLLTKEDGTFYLGSNATSPSKVKINPTSIPLKTIVDSQKSGGYKTTIEYTIVGNSSVEITADMEIKNTKDDQTALSKKDIDITITNSNLICSARNKPVKTYMKNLDYTLFPWGGGDGSKNPYENIYFVDYIPEKESVENLGTIDFIDLSDTEKGTPANSVVAWSINNGNKGGYYCSPGPGECSENETLKLEDLYIGSESEIFATDLSNLSNYMVNLKSITFDNLNTSETTNMEKLFNVNATGACLDSYCDAMVKDLGITTINGLKKLDTSKVTNMRKMFTAYKGNALDLSTFDTSSVTDMSSMFDECSNLTELKINKMTFDGLTSSNSYSCIFGNVLGNLDYRVPSNIHIVVKSGQDDFIRSRLDEAYPDGHTANIEVVS